MGRGSWGVVGGPAVLLVNRFLFFVVGLLFTLGLGGCARSPSRVPPSDRPPFTRIIVFADDFHSGVVIPRRDLPWNLDPLVSALGQTLPGRSFHYGEQAWTSGEDMSRLHAVRLAFIPGDGVIQSDATELGHPQIPSLDPDTRRVWIFPCTEAARDALVLRLKTEWLMPDPIAVRAVEAEATHLFACRHSWSVWHNCHDFTADLLRAAGLNLPSHTIATAGVFARDLDLAVEALHAGRVTALDP